MCGRSSSCSKSVICACHEHSHEPVLKKFVVESQNSFVTCNMDAEMDSTTVIKEELLEEELTEIESELNGFPFVDCDVKNGIVPSESHFMAETVTHSDHPETVIKVEIKEEPSWTESESTEPKLESEEAPTLSDDFQNEKDSTFCIYEDISQPETPRLYKEAVSTVEDGASNLEKRVCSADSKQCECEVCHKTLKWLPDLKRHNLVCDVKTPCKCDFCEHTSSQELCLKKRNLIYEGKEVSKCGNGYTQLSSLNKHKLSHEGKRPYECEVCGKCFRCSSDLKLHSVTHWNKTAHKCKACEKRFIFLFELEKHSLIHKGNKPHKCKHCSRSFARASNLKAHILIHDGVSPHKCDICEKKFSRLGDVKRHKVVHLNQRPQNCEIRK